MKRLPAALATVLVVLTAGCGDDGSGQAEPKAAASTEASATPTPEVSAPTEPATESEAAPEDTELTESASPDPSRVEEIGEVLGCSLADGVKAPDGETEYECGEFLIVDWGTAEVTEDEMWAHVDSWVDEQRPSYLPADQFIFVYGTQDALEPHSDELLGR